MMNIDLFKYAKIEWKGFSKSQRDFISNLNKVRELGFDKWVNQLSEEEKNKLHLSCLNSPSFANEVESQFRSLIKNNIKIIFLSDENYPRSFLRLNHSPKILTFIGSANWMNGSHLGIVGSRQISSQSRYWLELNLKKVLNEFPIATISGGARGCDQLAHKISYLQKLPTYCFLPSGLLNPYPSVIREWFGYIIEMGGAIVSPFSPDSTMQKWHFPYRNHLIASLSGVLLAIDGRRRSGTMITARSAMDQGKIVSTLPQHPYSNIGMGSLDLIYEGAIPLRDHFDLLALCYNNVTKLSTN